jgi:hypothetical protein
MFGPVVATRTAASASVNPCGELFIRSKTASLSSRDTSSRIGEK